MSDDEWDAEGFEVSVPDPKRNATDKWEGEDEDDDIKDNWDDEDKEEDDDDKEQIVATKAKKKRPLKEIIAEKEERKKKELEEKKRMEAEQQERNKNLTPQQQREEKMRQQRLQEEADLMVAMEAFGAPQLSDVNQIDTMEPSSREDFEKFEHLLRDKITKYEKSPYFVPFLETLFRDLVVSVDTEDIKKLTTTLNAIANEKVKQQKGGKSKKKSKTKASLVVGKQDATDIIDDGGYDEYDDFI